MATRADRTRLLKIIRLRAGLWPFSGESSLAQPSVGISPVSMRPFCFPLNMAVQHHPEEVDPRVEQRVGKAPRDALRGAGSVHHEQDPVEGAPEARDGEHLARHRRVEEDHVSLFVEGPDSSNELGRIREGPRSRQDRTGWDDLQVRCCLEAVVLRVSVALQSTGEADEVRPAETAVQVRSVQVAVHDGYLLSGGRERRAQAEADRGSSRPALRAGNYHAPRWSPQGDEVLRQGSERRPGLEAPRQESTRPRDTPRPRSPLVGSARAVRGVHPWARSASASREKGPSESPSEQSGITPKTGARSVSSASLEPLHRRARPSRKRAPMPPTRSPKAPAPIAARNAFGPERRSGVSAYLPTLASTATVPPASLPSSSSTCSTKTST